jgi:multidrug resistance protein, MATE family
MSSFLPNFVRLAIVNILSNLMVPLAGLIDTAFLGHLADIRHLAGVALATVIFNYVYWTFGFLRISTTGMTAQAVGRGDRDAVWLIALRHILLALVLGLVIFLLQVPLRSIGFTLLSATPEVKAAGQDYYNALIWGAPATCWCCR